MKKLFFRYFISIFSIAVVVLLIQFGVLLLQYNISQNRWKVRVYEDFVASSQETMSQGFYEGFGLNSLLVAFSGIDDDRVSGFIIRDVEGYNMISFGKDPEGRLLSSYIPTGARTQNDKTERTIKVRASRLNIVYDNTHKTSDVSVSLSSAADLDVSLPAVLRDQDIIGSIILAIDGEDSFIVDLLTYSPRTYEYSKDIINSCYRAILISVPICLLIALVAAWIISSRNTIYINSVRKALNDLSRGKSGVSVPPQDNTELDEISVAIEELDKSLQANAKSRKAWLQSISHDLNTPATAMKMIVDGLNDGVFPADEQTLKDLQKENDTLSERIGRVIDFSTLQADTEAAIQEVSTEQFVNEVLSGFDKAGEIEINAGCETLNCDCTLMARAARELLKNATEAKTGEDSVKWSISATEDSFVMEVLNEGKLSEDMDADFFEPWARGDWSRTSGGSGLGLPIASTIAQLHKGTISVIQADESHVKATIIWPR